MLTHTCAWGCPPIQNTATFSIFINKSLKFFQEDENNNNVLYCEHDWPFVTFYEYGDDTAGCKPFIPTPLTIKEIREREEGTMRYEPTIPPLHIFSYPVLSHALQVIKKKQKTANVNISLFWKKDNLKKTHWIWHWLEIWIDRSLLCIATATKKEEQQTRKFENYFHKQ